ncbi:hypothetical protein B0H16DRAFT_1579585 [Mycena metata]|uniref:Uncharacterized protein n=1 Tax=Mycena metata TaxID=1033252 RepID=A0AAD7MUF0_9AGAR|nr:hypothetical protein B0H16DRAFT_1579585 [Mycena metata]
MRITGGKDGVWNENIVGKKDVARKEGCRVIADRVNDGRNWGRYPFGEGVRKWSSLRKEAVVSTSNGTPRMSRLAAEGRKVAWGPRYGLSVDRVDGGDGGGREVVGPGQRWGDCYGFRRQIIDIIAIFVEGPNGEDSPTRVVGASLQPNESIRGWWRRRRR